MIITIDGPTASGKSTVAKMLAKKLNFTHLNSGLLYRGIAYILVHNFDYDEEKLKDPNQIDLDSIVNSGKFQYLYENDKPKVIYDGVDITSHLKTREMDNYSSISSANPKVRESLMAIQRKVGEQSNLVAEGRDTGTKVFPSADFKVFLMASLDVRAARWQKFMADKGKIYSLDEAKSLVDERDQRDINREVAPLVKAVDGVEVDNSSIGLDETVDLIISFVK